MSIFCFYVTFYTFCPNNLCICFFNILYARYGSTSPEISIISEILLENADLLILLVDYAEELLRSGENSKDVNNKD